MIPFERPALRIMRGQEGQRFTQLGFRHMQALAGGGELVASGLVAGRISCQWQIVRAVAAGTRKAVAFRRLGDSVSQWHPAIGPGGEVGIEPGLLSQLDGVYTPDKACRVAPIDPDGLEPIELKMRIQPAFATLLGDLGTLLDTAAIEDHDRGDESAVFRPPPSRCPIAASLLLERTVAEKRDKPFAW
ncbi:MAG TPA: hypothetical protein VM512_05495, partial [Burkholderiaceae bacterium]|nr:hypothetical protein [Burkholderiaceae bacterium]